MRGVFANTVELWPTITNSATRQYSYAAPGFKNVLTDHRRHSLFNKLKEITLKLCLIMLFFLAGSRQRAPQKTYSKY